MRPQLKQVITVLINRTHRVSKTNKVRSWAILGANTITRELSVTKTDKLHGVVFHYSPPKKYKKNYGLAGSLKSGFNYLKFFLLTGAPLIFQVQIPLKNQALKEIPQRLTRDLVLRKFRGLLAQKTPCRI